MFCKIRKSAHLCRRIWFISANKLKCSSWTRNFSGRSANCNWNVHGKCHLLFDQSHPRYNEMQSISTFNICFHNLILYECVCGKGDVGSLWTCLPSPQHHKFAKICIGNIKMIGRLFSTFQEVISAHFECYLIPANRMVANISGKIQNLLKFDLFERAFCT